ncbi:MAG: NAD(P)-binding protein, partial [Burkholderiaceae bacterium]
MTTKYYDIIIIGSGMAGLYSAYNIKNTSPDTSFLVLEKYKKNWIGGRTSNEIFYGTEIVTGAGIGRKNKDKLLHKLLTNLKFHLPEYTVNPQYSQLMERVDIKKIMTHLRKEYKKFKDQQLTFKQFATNILGEKEYKKFIISAGYTDYENEDVFETLYYYGMEDNACCWKA